MLHLAMGFIAIISLAAVALIARQVTPGSTIAQLDLTLARALDESRAPAWHRFFQLVTLAGSGLALGIASALVGLYLLFRRRLMLAIGWGVAQLGAVTLVKGVKAIVQRTRPGLGDTTFFASGWSFPSGHVVRTFAFCFMGAYLVWLFTRSRRATATVCVLAAAASIVMAFSRLYLGAHFASDVIAGLVVGAAWVAVCISVMEEVLRRSEQRAGTDPG
ncbi:MAG TPA: phosphatase PAP2 family protein [Gemmatimonadaceae bacterium]|nr:phosphatase PAP2 family protein [Gemmatimonadaceae bacterium]